MQTLRVLVAVMLSVTVQVFEFPRGGDENLNLDLSFKVNSRLLIAQWSLDKCYLEYFEWGKGGAKLLDKSIVGEWDVCLSRRASDPR